MPREGWVGGKPANFFLKRDIRRDPRKRDEESAAFQGLEKRKPRTSCSQIGADAPTRRGGGTRVVKEISVLMAAV